MFSTDRFSSYSLVSTSAPAAASNDEVVKREFNAILEKKGRMVDIDIPTDSKYEATLKIFDSVDKVYDVNGSKCKIVGSFCSVTDSKEVTLTLFFEEEGGLHNIKVELPSHLSIPERYKAKRQKLQDEGERVYRELYLKQSDIVLIGMPGSGKSTLGRMLAERTGRKFVDTDEEFTKKFEMTPGDCIRTQGEDAFREKETQVVKEVAAGTGLVIATGGGVVTRPKNIELLKQNGEIVYINRDISNLSSKGRPLSQGDGAIEKLFEIRKPLYEKAADYIVNAEEGKVDITCDSIESNFR